MSNFVHLHNHTEYSLLDGAARINDLVQKAAEWGMPAVAITDHGTMFGAIDFYKACRRAGIKPIIGCEVYVAPRTLRDREPGLDDKSAHLVLLAANLTGYRNLLRLVSLSYTEGFYYKPRVDKEVLAQYHEGLLALSGCLAGEIPRAILAERWERVQEILAGYLDIFGERFYLELQDHGMPEQAKVNQGLIKLAQQSDAPLVATNDVHYVQQKQNEIQDILLCIQTGKTVLDEQRFKFQADQFYFKSAAEMSQLFEEVPAAIHNTLQIAEQCNLEIDFDTLHLPKYQVPPQYDSVSYLRELCYLGAKKRYGNLDEQVRHRLEIELKTIANMGYSSYFLIVWDFIRFAREKNILVGPGRGSAAGSLVAYVLGITNVDPLSYGLLFERFLNPERVSMPDIDIDFCFERRGEVIDYIFDKYGKDSVAQIGTFGTMAARAAVRDVGRALGMPYSEVDRVAKLIPAELGMTIEKALRTGELAELCKREEPVKQLVEKAWELEGMPRHVSIHAAGVVIARDALTNHVPLYRTSDGVVATQFAKEPIEELGLLKMDILGLRTLTVIGEAVKLVRQHRGVQIDVDKLTLDDPATYELLSRGDTVGVFQLESSGMRGIMRELRPEVFEDIIALVALYRPGPLGSGMVEDFISRKHGDTEVEYLHPQLKPILKDTYGVILYQEQVMRIASDLAGFSLGEADLLRRAMGKKKPEIIDGLRKKFIAGAAQNQIDEETAGEIFELMAYFAGYGFNKSHSAAYALIAYQTAYLKANYLTEYMTALLTSVRDNTDKVSVYVEECREQGLEVLPPDVNESRQDFTVVDGKIRFGLAGVRNLGGNAVNLIIQNREQEGPYRDILDFCTRLDGRVVNKRILESLIRAGALVGFGSRKQLLTVLDEVLQRAQCLQKEKNSGQVSLFSDVDEVAAGFTPGIALPEVPEFERDEILAMEKEMLGLYISGHPLQEYQKHLRQVTSANAAEVPQLAPGQQVILGGLVVTKRAITTKKGDPMCFLTLEDLTARVEVIVFPKTYARYKQLVQDDALILVNGTVNNNNSEDNKIIADYISDLKQNTESSLFGCP